MATPSLQLKIMISVLTMLLFIIFSMPVVYAFMNGITKSIGFEVVNRNGCPSSAGLLLHGFLFGLVVFVIML